MAYEEAVQHVILVEVVVEAAVEGALLEVGGLDGLVDMAIPHPGSIAESIAVACNFVQFCWKRSCFQEDGISRAFHEDGESATLRSVLSALEECVLGVVQP